MMESKNKSQIHFARSFCYSLLLLANLLANAASYASSQHEKSLLPHWIIYNPMSQNVIDHSVWQKILEKHVETDAEGINLMDYAGFTPDDRHQLTQYITRLANIDITRYNRPEQLAYWLNLYNALVTKLILDHYPVRSIRDINVSAGMFVSEPWDMHIVQVRGHTLSLNDILHRIIRPIWNDPRTLYAIHAGTMGGANLQKMAFTGAELEKQLNYAAEDYINSLRGVNVINDKLIISSLYDWYRDDFGSTDKAIIKHLKIYAHPDLLKNLEHMADISETMYNWHLNQQRHP